MLKNKGIIKLFLVLFALVFVAFGACTNASAYTQIEKKALGYDIRRCYKNGTIKISKTTPEKFSNTKDLIGNGSGGKVPLPTGFYKVGDNISCSDLFLGAFNTNNFGGVLPAEFKGSNGTSLDTSSKNKLLGLLGYSSNEEVNSAGGCFYFEVYYESVGVSSYKTGNVNTHNVCSSDGRINENSVTVDSANNSSPVVIKQSKNKKSITISGGCSVLKGEKEFLLNDYTSLESLRSSMLSYIIGNFKPVTNCGGYNYSFRTTQPGIDSSGSSSSTRSYEINVNDEKTVLRAINNLLGSQLALTNSPSPLKFSANEKYDLYMTYLKDFYGTKGAEPKCNPGENNEASAEVLEQGGYIKIPYIQSGKVKYCYNKPLANVNKSVNGLNDDSYFDGTQLNFNDLIKALNAAVEDPSFRASAVSNGSPDKPTPSGDNEEKENPCKEQGRSLGWLLCSILEFTARSSETLYNNYVKKALQVQPSLFENGATRNAWGTFQSIANVIFIIIFLVVIFSQLTGMGIDNYGVKRILPKLVVVAVLVNLSYYLCILAIDVSNIVGNGLQSVFEGLSPETPTSVGGIGINPNELISIGILAGAFAAGWAVISNPAILLSLLVSGIGILISMFFMFVLLSAREAAIVILVVLAPVAIVCYSLPNTKKVFDTWKQGMTALLLLYPICGALVGGCNFISKLLITANPNGDFFFALTAMVVGIAPIFFIPTLLRNSMAALGNIGATISNFGDRVRGGFERGARGSALYRDATRYSAARRDERNAERRARIFGGVDRDGNARELGRLGTLLRGGKRNVARSRAAYLRNQDARNREANLLGGGFAAGLAGVAARADADMVSNAEAMLSYGRVGVDGGAVTGSNPAVNANDANSMRAYHAAALNRYNSAANEKDRAAAMAEIKAAQNIMAKTDKGREAIRSNFADAIADGNTGGLNDAASHLMSNYGDKIKSVDRGTHQMLMDLATNASAEAVQQKMGDGTYDKAGIDKYTEETLAGADEGAIQRLVNSMNLQDSEGNSVMTEAEKRTIRETAQRALRKMETGNLNVKPEVASQLKQIVAGSGIGPVPTPPRSNPDADLNEVLRIRHR